MNKSFYFILGLISLILGVIGILLPILPTTPFLLLAGFSFAKSSKKFERKLKNSKLYNFYVGDYAETKSISKKKKKYIIVQIYILMAISIYFCPIKIVKLLLFALTIFITYYLFKVIPNKDDN